MPGFGVNLTVETRDEEMIDTQFTEAQLRWTLCSEGLFLWAVGLARLGRGLSAGEQSRVWSSRRWMLPTSTRDQKALPASRG